ncbi:hypothetical protein ACROYT_G005271 [Oculina patagonica]
MHQISPVCLWQKSESPNRPQAFRSIVQETIIPNTTEITANDVKKLKTTVKSGWLEKKSQVDPELPEYWNIKEEISVCADLIMRSDKLIVPISLRDEMLRVIHSSHLGIEKCKRRARDILFLPGMNQQIADVVSKCNTCNMYRNSQAKEPLKSHELPERPWQKIAVDLFELDEQEYVVMVDYYSKFFEVSHLPNSKSKTVINHIKLQFARYGIPEVIVSDNGYEFSSHEFAEFANEYGFKHITSSPRYPQSNGLAERAVQTAKNLMKKAKHNTSVQIEKQKRQLRRLCRYGEKHRDKNKALLEYRATPIPGIDLSPSQLSMGRWLRTTLPIARGLLEPETYNIKEVKARMNNAKEQQKYVYDRQGTKDLPPLKPGDPIRVKPEPWSKEWRAATAVQKHALPI